MNLANWWHKLREPEPSPIPDAVRETRRLTAEVARIADQLQRLNDTKERRA